MSGTLTRRALVGGMTAGLTAGLAAAPFVRAAKFWPSVGRLNNVLGDRKLFCTCPDVGDYADPSI